LYRLGTI